MQLQPGAHDSAIPRLVLKFSHLFIALAEEESIFGKLVFSYFFAGSSMFPTCPQSTNLRLCVYMAGLSDPNLMRLSWSEQLRECIAVAN